MGRFGARRRRPSAPSPLLRRTAALLLLLAVSRLLLLPLPRSLSTGADASANSVSFDKAFASAVLPLAPPSSLRPPAPSVANLSAPIPGAELGVCAVHVVHDDDILSPSSSSSSSSASAVRYAAATQRSHSSMYAELYVHVHVRSRSPLALSTALPGGASMSRAAYSATDDWEASVVRNVRRTGLDCKVLLVADARTLFSPSDVLLAVRTLRAHPPAVRLLPARTLYSRASLNASSAAASAPLRDALTRHRLLFPTFAMLRSADTPPPPDDAPAEHIGSFVCSLPRTICRGGAPMRPALDTALAARARANAAAKLGDRAALVLLNDRPLRVFARAVAMRGTAAGVLRSYAALFVRRAGRAARSLKQDPHSPRARHGRHALRFALAYMLSADREYARLSSYSISVALRSSHPPISSSAPSTLPWESDVCHALDAVRLLRRLPLSGHPLESPVPLAPAFLANCASDTVPFDLACVCAMRFAGRVKPLTALLARLERQGARTGSLERHVLLAVVGAGWPPALVARVRRRVRARPVLAANDVWMFRAARSALDGASWEAVEDELGVRIDSAGGLFKEQANRTEEDGSEEEEEGEAPVGWSMGIDIIPAVDLDAKRQGSTDDLEVVVEQQERESGDSDDREEGGATAQTAGLSEDARNLKETVKIPLTVMRPGE